jgi:hypothetical protein
VAEEEEELAAEVAAEVVVPGMLAAEVVVQQEGDRKQYRATLPLLRASTHLQAGALA